MKKLMSIIAIIGMFAYVGSSANAATIMADNTSVSIVDNTQTPDDDKCPACGSAECTGDCKANKTKKECSEKKTVKKSECGDKKKAVKKSNCEEKKTPCCDKKK